MNQSIQVLVRIKPTSLKSTSKIANNQPSKLENDDSISGSCIDIIDGKSISLLKTTDGGSKNLRETRKVFSVHKVLPINCLQDHVYEAVSKSVTEVVSGQNVAIVTYGVVDAGKTYTMYGTNTEPGIVPKAIVDFFGAVENITIRENYNQLYYVEMSYVEMYNNQIHNLLKNVNTSMESKTDNIADDENNSQNDGSRSASFDTCDINKHQSGPFGSSKSNKKPIEKIDIRESVNVGIFLSSNTPTDPVRLQVNSAKEVMMILARANKIRMKKNREKSNDGKNIISRRGHTVLSFHVECRYLHAKELVLSKLQFVDLAGVDLSSQAGTTTSVQSNGKSSVKVNAETLNINTSLTSFGDVLYALATSKLTPTAAKTRSTTPTPTSSATAKLTSKNLHSSIAGTIVLSNSQLANTSSLETNPPLSNTSSLSHVPYKNSKLTHFMKEIFGGSFRTIMIAHIRPESEYYPLIRTTLQYGTWAANIHNVPSINKRSFSKLEGIWAYEDDAEAQRIVTSMDARTNEFIRIHQELQKSRNHFESNDLTNESKNLAVDFDREMPPDLKSSEKETVRIEMVKSELNGLVEDQSYEPSNIDDGKAVDSNLSSNPMQGAKLIPPDDGAASENDKGVDWLNQMDNMSLMNMMPAGVDQDDNPPDEQSMAIIEAWKEKVKELKDSKKKLKEENIIIGVQVEKLTKELKSLAALQETTSLQNLHQKIQFENLSKEVQVLKASKDSLENENINLRVRAAKVPRDAAAVKAERDSLSKENLQLSVSLATNMNELRDWKSRSERLLKELVNAKHQIDSLTQQLEMKSNEVDQKDEEINELNQNKVNLLEQLADLKQVRDASRKESTYVSNQLSKAHEEIAALKNKLHDTQTLLTNTTNELTSVKKTMELNAVSSVNPSDGAEKMETVVIQKSDDRVEALEMEKIELEKRNKEFLDKIVEYIGCNEQQLESIQSLEKQIEDKKAAETHLNQTEDTTDATVMGGSPHLVSAERQEKMDELQKELNDLKKKHDQLQVDFESSQSEIILIRNDKEMAEKDFQDINEQLMSTIQLLQTKLRRPSFSATPVHSMPPSNHVNHTPDHNDFDNQLVKLNSDVKSSNDRISRLEKELSEAKQARDQLTLDNSNYKKKNTKLMRDLTEIQNSISVSELRIESLESTSREEMLTKAASSSLPSVVPNELGVLTPFKKANSFNLSQSHVNNPPPSGSKRGGSSHNSTGIPIRKNGNGTDAVKGSVVKGPGLDDNELLNEKLDQLGLEVMNYKIMNEELQGKVTELSVKLETMELERISWMTIRDENNELKERLEIVMKESEEKSNQLQQDMIEFEKEKGDWVKKSQEFIEKEKVFNVLLNEINQKNKEYQQEIIQLKYSIQEKNQINHKLQSSIDEMNQKSEEWKGLKRQLLSQINELTNELNATIHKSTFSFKQINDITSEVEKKSQQLEQLQIKYEKLQKKMLNVKQEMNFYQENHNVLASQVQDLSVLSESRRLEIEDMKNKLLEMEEKELKWMEMKEEMDGKRMEKKAGLMEDDEDGMIHSKEEYHELMNQQNLMNKMLEDLQNECEMNSDMISEIQSERDQLQSQLNGLKLALERKDQLLSLIFKTGTRVNDLASQLNSNKVQMIKDVTTTTITTATSGTESSHKMGPYGLHSQVMVIQALVNQMTKLLAGLNETKPNDPL